MTPVPMRPEADDVPLPLVAQALGVSWHAAYRLALNGTLQARLVLGRWVVSRESLERLMCARAAGSSTHGARK